MFFAVMLNVLENTERIIDMEGISNKMIDEATAELRKRLLVTTGRKEEAEAWDDLQVLLWGLDRIDEKVDEILRGGK